ncbi:MAG: hypothetical protein ACPHV3_01045 [Vibrio sp.]
MLLNQLQFQANPMHGEATCHELEDFFKAHKSTLDAHLIPDLSYLDPRALPVDGIMIKQVEHVEGAKYRLNYSYGWAAFGGCVGLDESGTDMNKVSFILNQDGSFEFDLTALGNA